MSRQGTAPERAEARWHPIAAEHDVPYRHVFHGQLLGRELAVWRADDGFINVWQNRCLHRGLRLSIGINDGCELKCQYHGWRYASRSAGCTYIPAQPADAPARTIANRVYPSAERYGLIWTAERASVELPAVPRLDEGRPFVLRGIAVNASAGRIVEMLQRYRFQPSERVDEDDANVSVEETGHFIVALRSRSGGAATSAVFFIQPVESERSVIRGVLDKEPAADVRGSVLRHHNERMSALRDAVEREAAAHVRTAPAIDVEPVPAVKPRPATLQVQVGRKWRAADGVVGFELVPLAGTLPAAQPGAHIDVHLPTGCRRQYSLINGPGESARYVIGVKRELNSQGGSSYLCETAAEGDVLAVSEPRNNFPLRRDAAKTLLIAGGIGITPLLAMAQTLQRSRLPYELHYFAQSRGHLAFPDRLDKLTALKPHVGLDPREVREKLGELFSGRERGMRLYLCGPGPMLVAARQIAAGNGWADEAVHFEFFKNANKIDSSSSFEIVLARSDMTLQVPAGTAILDVLRANGIDMPSSCEQGACGTCMATVLDGEPDHQDVYLNETERKRGAKILTCVSRSRSKRLTLDI